jgi:hypothetical protein
MSTIGLMSISAAPDMFFGGDPTNFDDHLFRSRVRKLLIWINQFSPSEAFWCP